MSLWKPCSEATTRDTKLIAKSRKLWEKQSLKKIYAAIICNGIIINLMQKQRDYVNMA